MARLPSLGPRGEGWVLLQAVLLVLVVAAAWSLGPDWSGPLRLAGYAAGVTFLAIGLFLILRGVSDLGRARTPVPRPREGGELVETGIYAVVRHPIYTAIVLIVVGLWMRKPTIVIFLGTIAVIGFLRAKVEFEETLLVERYPDYAAYRERTWGLIPFMGKRPHRR